jgi:hypothetical protein
MSRQGLAHRQEMVLHALLRGEVPDGFDTRSAALTSRVLWTKRRSEAVETVPALRTVPGWADRFDAWAAQHPRTGCAHDDVLDFLVDVTDDLPEPLASIRDVERVYRRRATRARDHRPGHPRWVVAAAGRVWHLGPPAR